MPHAAQPQLRASRSLAVARDGYLSDSSSANETVHPSRAHLKGHTSDHDLTPTKQSFFDLHESLSSLSEPRLRALLLSLAANHPEIEPMIVQELRTQPKIMSNARTPEAKLKKERIRRGSSASRKGEKCLTCGLRPKVADKDKEVSCCGAGASVSVNAGVRACRYHPG
ncbi:hypothetical protein AX16_008300 [Volvariella volvacea WC 439]|nr:hypothetical protein AX16_008300 [Volvariella volvacea WC 439]